jgi:hypothetical protein
MLTVMSLRILDFPWTEQALLWGPTHERWVRDLADGAAEGDLSPLRRLEPL